MKNTDKKPLIPTSKFKIPIFGIPDTPIISSAQKFVPVADITDDIVIFKDGGAALVLESTSLNFGLLSEKEQEAVIVAYGALINSLSFPIQIVVRSQIKDIRRYMQYLDRARGNITNPKLLKVMESYQQFVRDTIKKRNVLGKNFYIVLPFTPYELGGAKSAASAAKRSGPLPFSKSYAVKKAKIALYPKRDHLSRQAGRLGIKLRQLTTSQLIDLYYSIFNAEPPVSILKKEDLI